MLRNVGRGGSRNLHKGGGRSLPSRLFSSLLFSCLPLPFPSFPLFFPFPPFEAAPSNQLGSAIYARAENEFGIHSTAVAVRKPLVAIVFSILKWMVAIILNILSAMFYVLWCLKR